jgi:hypothetical protein
MLKINNTITEQTYKRVDVEIETPAYYTGLGYFKESVIITDDSLINFSNTFIHVVPVHHDVAVKKIDEALQTERKDIEEGIAHLERTMKAIVESARAAHLSPENA